MERPTAEDLLKHEFLRSKDKKPENWTLVDIATEISKVDRSPVDSIAASLV